MEFSVGPMHPSTLAESKLEIRVLYPPIRKRIPDIATPTVTTFCLHAFYVSKHVSVKCLVSNFSICQDSLEKREKEACCVLLPYIFLVFIDLLFKQLCFLFCFLVSVFVIGAYYSHQHGSTFITDAI